jgi:hypothetical protein
MTRLVLIDADPLAYRAVYSKGGDTLSGVMEKINDLYQKITEDIIYEFGNDLKYQSYLTGKNNFRHDIAKDYKGQRPKVQLLLMGKKLMMPLLLLPQSIILMLSWFRLTKTSDKCRESCTTL